MPMHDDLPSPLSGLAVLGRLGAIGLVLLVVLAGFAYTGGWLSPGRLNPVGFVDRFQEVNGVYPGFRRNHAKGLCLIGVFDSNGQGQRLSTASVFRAGRFPLIGRFALAGGQPFVADGPQTVRSMALRFTLPDGQEWRTGMNDIPVFPFATPASFYAQMLAFRNDPATGKPDPAQVKAFLERYPETARALAAIRAQPVASGFDNSTYNSLDAFRFVDGQGRSIAVRWAMVPEQPFEPEDPKAAAGPDKNYLFDALMARMAQGPLQWHLIVTVGQPGDPTDNATIAWPADRQKLEVGTLTVNRLVGEAEGVCRDVNFDPTVLPAGIELSDDPLLSARSAVYAQSYERRAGEMREPSAVRTPEMGIGAGQ
jgi:catalase